MSMQMNELLTRPSRAKPDEWQWEEQLPDVYIVPGQLIACRKVRGAIELRKFNILRPDTVSVESSGAEYETPLMRVVSVGCDVKVKVKRGDLLLIAPGVNMYKSIFDGKRVHYAHEQGILAVISDPELIAKWDQPNIPAVESVT